MSFPTADMQAAFGDFLIVNALRRYLERHRPDLLVHVRHGKGQLFIGLALPDGRYVVCAHTQVGIVTGWACIIPASTEDDVRALMSNDGAHLAKYMADH